MIAENTALTEAVKSATDLLDEIHLHVANIGMAVGADREVRAEVTAGLADLGGFDLNDVPARRSGNNCPGSRPGPGTARTLR